MKRLLVPHAAIITSYLYEPILERDRDTRKFYALTIDRRKLPVSALENCPPGTPSRDGSKLYVTFKSANAPRIFIDRKQVKEMTEREQHARYENRQLNSVLQGLDLIVIYQKQILSGIEPQF